MNSYADLVQRQVATKQILADLKEMLEDDLYNPITLTCSAKSEPVRTAPIMPEDGFWRGIIFARTTKAYSPDTRTSKDVDSYLRRILKAAQQLGIHTKQLGEFRRRDMLCILDHIAFTPDCFNHCIAYLRPLFEILITYEALEVNPVDKIPKRIKPNSSMRKTLSPTERRVVDIHLCKSDRRFWLFMQIFFHSGGRIIELLRLKSEDVDLSRQIFTVTVRKGRNGSARRKDRPIKDVALKYWNEYLKGFDGEPFIFCKGFKPGKVALGSSWPTHLWEKLVKVELGIDVDLSVEV
jgi:integrase